MLRSVGSKVAWVGRTASMVFGLALVLALVVGVSSAALAGNLDPLKIGSLRNVATNTTALVGKVASGEALVVKNPSGGSALGLQVNAGKAPLTVNADAGKATNLDADKLDGKDSNDLAVRTAFASGSGANPTATSQFLAPPAVVQVGAGQAVHVTSNKAFGSTVTGGADSLDLFVCHRPQGSTDVPTIIGEGVFNNRVAQNTRVTMGLSGVITGLPAGSHQVGMCGDDDGNGNWNFNEFGYTSAMALTQPSAGATAASAIKVQSR